MKIYRRGNSEPEKDIKIKENIVISINGTMICLTRTEALDLFGKLKQHLKVV